MEEKSARVSIAGFVARVCLLGLLASLGYGGLVLVWQFSHVRSLGQLTACRANVQNLATSMEMYAADNKDHYPENLAALAPTYLKTIPGCASNQDGQPYNLEVSGSSFTILCAGRAHQGVYIQPDRPACNSDRGLDGGELGTSMLRKVLDMVTGAAPLHPSDARQD